MDKRRGISLGIILGIVLLSLAPKSTESSRILGLFPHHGESHFYFFEPILRALDEAGHEVHIVSHFEMKNMSNSNFRNILVSKPGSTHESMDLSVFSWRPSFIHFMEFFMLRGWGYENCEITLTTPEVQEMIKNKPHYDLILLEQFNSDCMFGIAHQINAPVIGLSSCAMLPWHYDRVGNPQTPSITPALFMGYSDKMDFQQRLSNWLAFYGMKALYYLFADTDTNSLIRKHIGADVPNVRKMVKGISMYFVNQHFSLGGAKPIVPSVIELGGIHIKEPKPLDEDLEAFISSAKHGVIYISWGSMIRPSTLPKDKLSAILNALSKFKQKVVWKWDGEIPDHPAKSKIFARKWLPQQDILCHPNVKAFWMHGGYGGSGEAAHCGVPVVSTPMYGDQFLNSAAFEERGAGIVVPYEEITSERAVQALKFALSPTTVEKAKKLSYAYNHRPVSPKELAVYWVEHTIAMGGQPLMKPSSPFIPWTVYYGLDVISVIITSLLVLAYSWSWLIKVACKKSTNKSGVKDEKKKKK